MAASVASKAGSSALVPSSENFSKRSKETQRVVNGRLSAIGLSTRHGASWSWQRRPRPALRVSATNVKAEDLEGFGRGHTQQKVKVNLGPYKDGAIKVTVEKTEITEEEIEKAWKAKIAKTHEFERINFTGSGAKLGHTVRINFDGKYADGPNAGQLIKGTKASMFELELKPRDDDPWKTFVQQITAFGMGQEESKSFELRFPSDYKAAALRNVLARFTVTVKEIGVKKPLPADPRPAEVQRAELASTMRADAERRTNERVDAEIRNALLTSSEADVEKVAASVSWAKFGEKSLMDFKWNLLIEEVARDEKIDFEQVRKFLRSQADISYKS